MQSIELNVTGTDCAVIRAPVLTSGMVGLQAHFTFDPVWEGFTKTAVFQAGGVVKTVVGITDTCTVPWEVLHTPYRMLRVGVYGVSQDGAVTIPTVWAAVDEIRVGTDPCGDPSTEQSLPVWEQIFRRLSIPTFHLEAMGLPVVPFDGTAVSVSTDTEALLAAAGKGPVFVTADLDIDENTCNYRILLNPVVADMNTIQLYGCVMVIDSSLVEGKPVSVTVMVSEGYIGVTVLPLAVK